MRLYAICVVKNEEDIIAAWEAGEDGADRSIMERRRYYSIDWSEPRLFRNRSHRHKASVDLRQAYCDRWGQATRKLRVIRGRLGV